MALASVLTTAAAILTTRVIADVTGRISMRHRAPVIHFTHKDHEEVLTLTKDGGNSCESFILNEAFKMKNT